MHRSLKYGQSFNTGALAQGNDDGVVMLKHREFIGVVNSSVGFQTQTYDLNPGLDRLMPWASGISASFQEYAFKSLSFEFISTSATSLVSGTNTALGQVAGAVQYDSLTPEFRNLSDMLNSQWATSTKISSDLITPVECEKYQTPTAPLYIRTGRAPGDLRLYDLGRFTLATYGAQSVNQIGQLFVCYELALFKPISYRQSGGSAESAFYTFYPASSDLIDRFAPRRPLASSQVEDVDTIGLTITQEVDNTSIEYPAGSSSYYILGLAYRNNNSTSAIITTGTFTLTNCRIETNFWGQSPYLPIPNNVPVAGDDSISTSRTGNPNFTYIINIIDPSLPAKLLFNSDWLSIAGQTASDRAVCNLYTAQLNIGFSSFVSPPPRNNDSCCADLQAQISALQQLVAELQEEEAESEEESEASDREEERRLRKIEHQIKECCESDKEDHHKMEAEPDKQSEEVKPSTNEELIKQLEEQIKVLKM
jgi:hypothetical protein